jgi:hypothetical protein
MHWLKEPTLRFPADGHTGWIGASRFVGLEECGDAEVEV